MGQEESRILESLDLAVKSDAIRAKINTIVAGSVIIIVNLCFYAVAPRSDSTVLCHGWCRYVVYKQHTSVGCT